MDDFINNFVQYEGISPKLPSQLSYFKYLSHPFFIKFPPSSVPIYTLNKVSVRVNHFELDDNPKNWKTSKSITHESMVSLPIFVEVEVTLYFTTSDLIHSIHSTSYHFSLFDALTYRPSTKHQNSFKPSLYVEDIFAYCPDTTHVYGHILLLATLPT